MLQMAFSKAKECMKKPTGYVMNISSGIFYPERATWNYFYKSQTDNILN